MSNSKLISFVRISPNKNSPRRHKIDTITIHCVAAQATVERLGQIFNGTRKVSANYGIGRDGRIGLYVDECDRSWCSSSAENDHRAITIEVASDNKPPYAVRPVAYNALLDLVEDICRRNGIKKLVWSANKYDRMNHRDGCNMTVHRDYANKACPGDFLYARHGAIAAEVNRRLGATILTLPIKKHEETYRVQTGAFKNHEYAEKFENRLKKLGYEAYTIQFGEFYRVFVGVYDSKETAYTTLRKLSKDGYKDAYIRISMNI